MTHEFKRPIYVLQKTINGFFFYINRGFSINHKAEEMTLDPEEAERFQNARLAYNFIKTFRLRGFEPVAYKPEIIEKVKVHQRKPKSTYVPIKIEKMEAFKL